MTSSERKARRLTMIIKDPVTGQEMCSLCGATFVYSKTLHDHIDAKHLGFLAYTCKYCDKRFTNRGNKYAHESQIHRYEKNQNLSAGAGNSGSKAKEKFSIINQLELS